MHLFGPFGFTIGCYTVGLLWIGEVGRRLPKDIEEFKTCDDWGHRFIIIAIWLITLCMIAGLVWNIGHLIQILYDAYKQLR